MYIKVLSKDSANNLSNNFNKGDWIVLYYAEWCGHCKTMKPEWDKFISQMKPNKHLNIADVNSNFMNDLQHKPVVDGFPTINMYNNGNVIAKFDDERVSDKMRSFALSNCTTSKTRNNKINTRSLLNILNKQHNRQNNRQNNRKKMRNTFIHNLLEDKTQSNPFQKLQPQYLDM